MMNDKEEEVQNVEETHDLNSEGIQAANPEIIPDEKEVSKPAI